jgi:hypothetical protein
MELIVGNLDTCKQINEELLVRSTSAAMKIIPLVLDVEVRMAGNEMSETITAAKRALRELGIAMPDRVHIPKFMLKLRKVRRMIRGKDDEYILGLPIIQDSDKDHLNEVVDAFIIVLFSARRNHDRQFIPPCWRLS